MRVLIVYESMYGNTHAVAEGIARGLRPAHEVRVLAAEDATREQVDWAEFLVVGGPTHVHGMTTATSRRGAHEAAEKPDSGLHLDAAAQGIGLRDWLETVGSLQGKRVAAFDTRFAGPAMLTGRAAKCIARRLRSHGGDAVTAPESFLVDRHNHLVAGEGDRAARRAGALVGTPVAAAV